MMPENFRKPIVMLAAALVALATSADRLPAAAIVSGFNSETLARNDDGSTGLESIGFDVNFFGVSFNSLYVNNNGNVTFDGALGTFTPFDLTSTGRQIIAPFFADVDTRSGGSPVTYGQGVFEGHAAFGANWVDVNVYPAGSSSLRNSFQLLLVDRSDIGLGDFDIIFNYDQIQWDTGSASSGVSARAGFSNGTGAPGTAFELPGSAVSGAFLDGGPNALVSNRLNSSIDGRYIFQARNGTVVDPSTVPEPASLAIFGLGGAGLAIRAVRRRKPQSA